MGKKYSNVSDLTRSISSDEKTKERTLREIKRTSLAKFLFFLRCEHNVTQKKLAEKIGCSQSRISKIESSYDRDLTVKDLIDYGCALDLQLQFGYRHKNVKIADLIKYHIMRTRDYLSSLTELAKGDEIIAKGVLAFVEGMIGFFSSSVMETMLKLDITKKKTTREAKDLIHISPPLKEKTELTEMANKG